ncbi:MAG TPA: hypothetical protein VGP38_02495, partial [Rubrobacter sp.]|nr:hypothetical protein [Rubrobacter sp.]
PVATDPVPTDPVPTDPVPADPVPTDPETAAPAAVPFSGPAPTGETEPQTLPEPAMALPLDPEAASASSEAPADSLTAAVSRLVHDLVGSGSDGVAGLLEQAGKLTDSLVEAAGALLGALGGTDGVTETVEQLMGGVGGLLNDLAQALFQMLGGSGQTPTSSGGPGGAPPSVPPPAAPAGPSGFAPASYSSFLGASGSTGGAIPLVLVVLCSFAIALLQGGKLSYHREPGRLRSTALRLTVERPG